MGRARFRDAAPGRVHEYAVQRGLRVAVLRGRVSGVSSRPHPVEPRTYWCVRRISSFVPVARFAIRLLRLRGSNQRGKDTSDAPRVLTPAWAASEAAHAFPFAEGDAHEPPHARCSYPAGSMSGGTLDAIGVTRTSRLMHP